MNSPPGVPAYVAQQFERLTLELISLGFKRHSADAILHRIRWSYQVERREGDFRVNNNHAAPLARWFIERNPQHSKFFEMRKSVAKAAPIFAYAD